MSKAEPFLEMRGVGKRFGALSALTDVDLELDPNELLVVLGPTGAGKTTLLRTIAGLEAPSAGSMKMGGKDALGLSPAERDVALVFQNFSLYPDWSARRNMEFPLRAPGRHLEEGAIRQRVEVGGRAAQNHSPARTACHALVRRRDAARGHWARHRTQAQAISNGRTADQLGRQAS